MESENHDSWPWFLTKLQDIISDDGELVFISNKNQNIKSVVGNVYKNAHHEYSMWHIQQNLKRHFSCMDSNDLFKQATQAYQVLQFNQFWNEIQSRYPRVVTYLTKNMDVSHW